MDEAKWYVVHTYSGYENKVRANIEKAAEAGGLENQIYDVIVPLEKVVEVKNGAKKTADRKMFPGYVLINMVMNDDTWYVVRNIRGVTGFVGPGSKPVPLTPAEIRSLGVEFPDSAESEDKIKVQFDGNVGDSVEILSGAWEGSVCEIASINESKQTLTIIADMFGRETSVEMSFTDVKLL